MISLLFSLIDSPRSMIIMIISRIFSDAFQGPTLTPLAPLPSSFLGSGRVEAHWLIMELLVTGTSTALSVIGSVTVLEAASFDICGDLIRKVDLRIQALSLGWFNANSAGRVTTATSTNISLLSCLPSTVIPRLASIAGTAFTLLPAALIYDWKMTLAMTACISPHIIALRLLARGVVHECAAEEATTQDLNVRIFEFTRLQAVLCTTDRLKNG